MRTRKPKQAKTRPPAPDAPEEPIYAEVLGDLPDGTYGNVEGGRRYEPHEFEELVERERARRNHANIAFTYPDGRRIRTYRFVSFDDEIRVVGGKVYF